MASNYRFTKGGSSAFLTTMKSASSRGPGRRNMTEVLSVMRELEPGPMSMEQLSKRFPLAESIVFGLMNDRLLEHTTHNGDPAVQLTETGRDFLKRSAAF
ncbi:MAG: hypothetical protein RLO51_00240 [Thalassobaculum sp.]|uniref:hypothetical protein n=1 Tax=Thalassobaculum sp. TaxID=2022740 RepID=UPI0032EDBE7C